MPAPNQKTGYAQTPASPRNLAKYTNKDGSKFITVPKSNPSDSSQPSTPTAAVPASSGPAAGPLPTEALPPAVNRKKQKRRQKAAAKMAAEQELAAATAAAAPATVSSIPNGHRGAGPSEWDDGDSDDEPENGLAGDTHTSINGQSGQAVKKKNKKKKKKGSANAGIPVTTPEASLPAAPVRTMGSSRDRIWSTSNQEERERIKDFWLGLGEEERKSLVKVEKDAVLRKMKEQQKHTCSCTVCGRKRTAIEEELEGLYDAYYLELEQFANQSDEPPMLQPHPSDFSGLRPPPRAPPAAYGPPPARGRIVEHVNDYEDDELGEDIFSEDEIEVDDDEYSENDEPPEADDFRDVHGGDVADFLTFGNSLQVKGGILTVADDLLKNDGKRFIEMMEQLAERRMAREEDARDHFRGYGHPNDSGAYAHHPHHHHIALEEEEYDDEEEDEEDYEDSQEEEYEDDEDPMTEEQRMEEGRRMFQIFAARMFEQRVLSAYKEKIAKERQEKLLEELEEESRQVDQQKARKAKNAQKKKDKAAQKKQAQAEEKARKEAEKVAEEAAKLEAEQRRAAEQQQKAEERRKQKEAQKKLEEEARLKKEADKQRRLHEQREKQAEQERKAREAKEKERKLKEEQRQKEKELREQKDREAQERKEKQDKDKREKEVRAARHAKEVQEAKEAKEKAREAKAAAATASAAPSGGGAGAPQQANGTTSQTTKKTVSAQPGVAPIPLPSVLPQQPPSAPHRRVSPKIPVATPVAATKAPTPIRKVSQHQQDNAQSTSSPGPFAAGPLSQNPSPRTDQLSSLVNSPGAIGQRKVSGELAASLSTAAQSMTPPGMPRVSSPLHIAPHSMHAHMQAPPGLPHQHHHPPPPGFPSRIPHEAMFPGGMRPGTNMMVPPPGMHGPPGGRGFAPMPIPPPGFPGGASEAFSMSQGRPDPQTMPPIHPQHGSMGFETAGPVGSSSGAQPIGRPTPIGRPGSGSNEQSEEIEDEKKPLGSRALIEDDEPLDLDFNPGSLRNHPPGPRSGTGPGGSGASAATVPFGSSPFAEPTFPVRGSVHNLWGPPAGSSLPFAQPHGFGTAASSWGAVPAAPPGFHVGSPSSAIGPMRPSQPRHIALRLWLCQACQSLGGTNAVYPDGSIDLGVVKSQVDTLSGGDASITEQDLLNLCDTEGSAVNGGGTFEVGRDVGGPGKHSVRWVPDPSEGNYYQSSKAFGAPGEIGSPVAGSASLRGI